MTAIVTKGSPNVLVNGLPVARQTDTTDGVTADDAASIAAGEAGQVVSSTLSDMQQAIAWGNSEINVTNDVFTMSSHLFLPGTGNNQAATIQDVLETTGNAISFPISIAQGGTFANNANAARTNLGLAVVANSGSYNDLSNIPFILDGANNIAFVRNTSTINSANSLALSSNGYYTWFYNDGQVSISNTLTVANNLFAGYISTNQTGLGFVTLNSGGNNAAGYIGIFNHVGERVGYIGYNENAFNFAADVGAINLNNQTTIQGNTQINGKLAASNFSGNSSGINTGDQTTLPPSGNAGGLLTGSYPNPTANSFYVYSSINANGITTTNSGNIGYTVGSGDSNKRCTWYCNAAAGYSVWNAQLDYGSATLFQWQANGNPILTLGPFTSTITGNFNTSALYANSISMQAVFIPQLGNTSWSIANTVSFGGLGIVYNLTGSQGEANFISGNGGADGYGFNFYSRSASGALNQLASINHSNTVFNTSATFTNNVQINGTLNSGGISLGSQTASANTDLSKHINLWGSNNYGFCVTSSTLNMVANGIRVSALDTTAYQGFNIYGYLRAAVNRPGDSYANIAGSSTGSGVSIGWNYTGVTGEVDFHNLYNTSTGGGFNWYSWGANTSSLLFGISSAGNLTVSGNTAGFGFSVNGDWYRTVGSTGWYNSTWAGGIYMTDATYLRSYNNKAMLASDFVISSDRSLKKNIIDMAPRAPLRPRTFIMKASGEKKFGFIAQEVETDYPEAVGEVTDENGKRIKQVSYSILIAALAAQLNETTKNITDLEDRIQILEQRLNHGNQ